MVPTRWFWMVAVVCVTFVAAEDVVFGEDAKLPRGVKAVWDMAKAYRETTLTQERICINGLWRWQSAMNAADKPPADLAALGQDRPGRQDDSPRHRQRHRYQPLHGFCLPKELPACPESSGGRPRPNGPPRPRL